MNLEDKTRTTTKKNVYLSLITACICLVFSLFILIGSTWAWFTADYTSSNNTITIGNYTINLSLQKLNKEEESKKLLKAVNNFKDDKDISIHEMLIDSSGDYLIKIVPSEQISGYCNLSITDENDISLLEKDSLVIKVDEPISFNVHTNKNLKISIFNVNWGSLVEYDELQEDYYFSDFKFIYDNGTIEYSELPENYKEVTYIESNGKQFTDDIVVGENIIIDKTFFTERIEGKKVFIDEVDQDIAYIYPCIDENGVGGLYVFDLINNIDSFYPNIGEEEFIIGEEVKHYGYELMSDDNSISVIYKDVIIEGEMDIDDTVYTYGIETSDKVKECAYKMEGFSFIGWKYEDKLVENLNDVLVTIDPTSPQEIVLTAVWDIDDKALTIDDQHINIRYNTESSLKEESEGKFNWPSKEEIKAILEARWKALIEKKENEIVDNSEEIIEETTNNEEPSVETEENIVETPSENEGSSIEIDENIVETPNENEETVSEEQITLTDESTTLNKQGGENE